ncbi:MAG: hypothetical protein DWQ40_02990 [Actinobacteria bacterium]|nr:MAG: hypothetical protein DWQ40_02990 [Actinomycetota bacterium]
MYEAVEFIELKEKPEPIQSVLGEFDTETAAVERARAARTAFLEGGSDDYAWWVVRKQGATLAEFIADSKSDKEFVLDLRSGQLVELV